MEVFFLGVVGGVDFLRSEVNMCELRIGMMIEIFDLFLVLGVWGIYLVSRVVVVVFWFLEIG